MPLRIQRGRHSKNAETRAPEMMAAELCALVYRQGKTDGRFEMQLDQLRKEAVWTKEALDTALIAAERSDWSRGSRSCVALKAAGIYVAKGVLGLPR